MNVRERVESLRTRNQVNIKAINKDLYKLIRDLSFLEHNYRRQASQLGKNSFQRFHETKRIINELPNERSVDYVKDKSFKRNIVQQTMVLILEAIYEPSFSRYNNDFGKNYYYTKNFIKIKKEWSTNTWIIQGTLNKHQLIIYPNVLFTILRKKIQDEKFLHELWTLLQTTAPNTHKKLVKILFNIYLNEVNLILEELRFKINRSIWDGKHLKDRFKDSSFNSLFSNSTLRLTKCHYVSTGNSWIIGLYGKKKMLDKLRQLLNLFLTRKVGLSIVQIKITYIPKTKVKFLGYIWVKKRQSSGNKKLGVTNLETNQKLHCVIPTKEIVKHLANRNFCTKLGKGVGKTEWILYPERVILQKYKTILKQLANNYFVGDNFIASIRRLEYILRFSCAHTLAKKYRSKVSKQMKRLRDLKFYDCKNVGMTNNVINFNPTARFLKASVESLATDSGFLKENTCLNCTTYKDLERHSIKILLKQDNFSKVANKNILLQQLHKKQTCVCKKCQLEIRKPIS